MEKHARLNYVDVCKALGIILVILGHTYDTPFSLYSSIYSFHMPLFFILAGFVYNREKNNCIGFGKYTVKLCKQYLIPYYIFSFANLALDVLLKTLYFRTPLRTDYLLVNFRGILLCYSNMSNMPNCSPVWFLMCLFIASLLFWWIQKLDFKISWIPVLGCVAVNFLILPYCESHTSFPFKFPTFLLAVFYLYIGYTLRMILDRNYQAMKGKFTSFVALVLIVVCLFTVVITENLIGMNENQYGNYMLALITSTVLSACVILIAKNHPILENRFMLWLGRNTIYIVGFNYVCRDIAIEIYYLIPVLRHFKMHWMAHFILTFVVCIGCILVCLILKSIVDRVILIRNTQHKFI